VNAPRGRIACVQSEVLKVLQLQGLDLRAADLRKEIAELPKHIAMIEKLVDSHQRKLLADQALLAAAQKERRQLDGDTQVQQQKISKLRDQMVSAKTNEQYRAFQHEIEFCEKEIRRFEDRILELMEEIEKLEVNVKAAEEQLKKEKTEVERQKGVARNRTAADQKKLADLMAERAEIVKTIAGSALNVYDKLSKKYNGVAVADATKGRCTACQLELRPQLYQELRTSTQLMFCENCRRLLLYNPSIDFDTATGSPAAVDPRTGSRVDMS